MECSLKSMNVNNKYNLKLLSNHRGCYCDLIECSIILGLEETGAIDCGQILMKCENCKKDFECQKIDLPRKTLPQLDLPEMWKAI